MLAKRWGATPSTLPSNPLESSMKSQAGRVGALKGLLGEWRQVLIKQIDACIVRAIGQRSMHPGSKVSARGSGCHVRRESVAGHEQ